MGNSQSFTNMAVKNVDNSAQTRAQSPTQSTPAAGPGSDPTTNSVDLCGTCNGATGSDGIGCDRCSNWFHPSTLCLGLHDQLIISIQEYAGSGIVFVSTVSHQ